MQGELVTDSERFASLRMEWDELLAARPASCFFLTWEWLYTWWKHLGRLAAAPSPARV